jgi:hypothetical protein
LLRQVAQGVLVHQSEFCQSNAVVVQGQSGVLLIDQDREYLHALRHADVVSDPRLDPAAEEGWVVGVHERQLHHGG